MEPNHYNFIKNLGYLPVGLGDKKFNSNWLGDKSEINISNKNRNYGEYTFHYWIWKNYLNELSDEWIGFCQYRKFWTHKENNKGEINLKNLNDYVIKGVPKELEGYESILGEPIFINQFRTMKFIKKGLGFFMKRPITIFNKKKRNLKFHFDFMHGENSLDKAIDLLDDENREDFRQYVNTEVSFNPHNMFICKSKQTLKNYYEVIFPWLVKCEKLFGFKNLKGFGQIRIYTFLAERFMPYWFKKNTRSMTLPIIFYDIRKDFN